MKLSPVDTKGLVTVVEPQEGAFTLLMPEGWNNNAHLQRDHGLNRIIASSTRPDGRAMIHLGDPRLPMFMEPGPFVDPSLMAFMPHVRVQPYVPAEPFFVDYLRQFFGRAPGFEITDTGPGEVLRSAQATHATAAAIGFRHAIDGKPMRCRLEGTTAHNGMAWLAEVSIASTMDDDLDALFLVARRMMRSRSFNPRWAAMQQQLHEHRMAMGRQNIAHTQAMTNVMTQGHNQRMADIAAWGQANTAMHESRMAQSDAAMASWTQAQSSADAAQSSWMRSQAQDDAMQQSRVNAVREEHTVVDASGSTYQVDIHHERYFVNKRDNTYIGAGGATERSDLARTHGVNPDDFEEVRVVR